MKSTIVKTQELGSFLNQFIEVLNIIPHKVKRNIDGEEITIEVLIVYREVWNNKEIKMTALEAKKLAKVSENSLFMLFAGIKTSASVGNTSMNITKISNQHIKELKRLGYKIYFEPKYDMYKIEW